jgi:hypothetical protein
MHHFVLINCVAFNNKGKGFDQNNNLGSMTLYNCTGYGNLVSNYRILRALVPGQVLTVKNCVSDNGNAELGTFAVQASNSWLTPFVVTAGDFVSLNGDSAGTARQAGGSLPEIAFMHLYEGSDLIDGGVDLGYPYKGSAPDLGAFESDFPTFAGNYQFPITNYQLYQNYPNPFNSNTKFQFTISKSGFLTLNIYDLLGQKVATLVEGKLEAGDHTVQFNASALASGVYFYRLQAGQDFVQMRKMVLVK